MSASGWGCSSDTDRSNEKAKYWLWAAWVSCDKETSRKAVINAISCGELSVSFSFSFWIEEFFLLLHRYKTRFHMVFLFTTYYLNRHSALCVEIPICPSVLQLRLFHTSPRSIRTTSKSLRNSDVLARGARAGTRESCAISLDTILDAKPMSGNSRIFGLWMDTSTANLPLSIFCIPTLSSN